MLRNKLCQAPKTRSGCWGFLFLSQGKEDRSSTAFVHNLPILPFILKLESSQSIQLLRSFCIEDIFVFELVRPPLQFPSPMECSQESLVHAVSEHCTRGQQVSSALTSSTQGTRSTSQYFPAFDQSWQYC